MASPWDVPPTEADRVAPADSWDKPPTEAERVEPELVPISQEAVDDEVKKRRDSMDVLRQLRDYALQDPKRMNAVLDISRKTGAPTKDVEANFDSFRAAVAQPDWDPEKWSRDNPGPYKALTENPEAAGVFLGDEKVSGLMLRLRSAVSLYAALHKPSTQQIMEGVGTIADAISNPALAGVRLKAAAKDFEQQATPSLLAVARAATPRSNVPQRMSPLASEEQTLGLPRLAVVGDVVGRSLDEVKKSHLATMQIQLDDEFAAAQRAGVPPARLAELEQRAYENEKAYLDLEHRLTVAPLYGTSNGLEQFVVDSARVATGIAPFVAGKMTAGGAGALALGGLTLVATRDLKAAVAAGRVGWEIFGDAGTALASFDQQAGPVYMSLRGAKAEDGTLIPDDIARSYSIMYGLTAAAVDTGAMHSILGMFGPGSAAIAQGQGLAWLKKAALSTQSKTVMRQILGSWMKGAAVGGAQMGLESLMRDMASWSAATEATHDAHPEAGWAAAEQSIDLQEGGVRHAETTVGAAIDMLKLGAWGVPRRVVSTGLGIHAALLHEKGMEKAAETVAPLAGLAVERGSAIPQALARAIEVESRLGGGTPLETVFIDPQKIVDYAKEHQLEVATVTTELMGEDGPKRHEAALTVRQDIPGGRATLAVPMREYLSKWGARGIAELLAPDASVRPDGWTLRELETARLEREKGVAERTKQLLEQWDAQGQHEPETPAEARFVDAIQKQLLSTQKLKEQDAKFAMANWYAIAETAAKRFKLPADAIFDYLSVRVGKGETSQRAFEAPAVEPVPRPTQQLPEATRLLSKRAAALEGDQRAREVFVDRNTGTYNERGYREIPHDPEKPLTAVYSFEGTKVRNRAGHTPGNELYRAFGQALAAEQENAAKYRGDFVGDVTTQAEAEAIAERAKARLTETLRQSNPELADRIQGLEVVATTAPRGEDVAAAVRAAADANVAERTRREEAGTRAPRGEQPKGLGDAKLETLKLPQEPAPSRPIDPELLRRAREMPDAVLVDTVYRDPKYRTMLTGDAFFALQREAPKAFVISMDLNGLKRINKEHGDAVGDAVLEAFAHFSKLAGASKMDMAHLAGDEFAARTDDPHLAQEFTDLLGSLTERVKLVDSEGKEILDGGITFGYGIDKTYDSADSRVEAHKRLGVEAERQARRDRADARRRGDLPQRGEALLGGDQEQGFQSDREGVAADPAGERAGRAEEIVDRLAALYVETLSKGTSKTAQTLAGGLDNIARTRRAIYGKTVDWNSEAGLESAHLRAELGQIRETEASQVREQLRPDERMVLPAHEVASAVLTEPAGREIAESVARAYEDAARGGPSDDAEILLPQRFYQYHSLGEWEQRTRSFLKNAWGWTESKIEREIAGRRGMAALQASITPSEADMLPHGFGKNPGPGFASVPDAAGTDWTHAPTGPFRSNVDPLYGLSVDLTANCVKRLEAQATMLAIQDELIARSVANGTPPIILGSGDRVALASMFKQAGLVAPCLYCYVESRRGNAGTLLDSSVRHIFGNAPVGEKWAESTLQAAAAARKEVLKKRLTAEDIDLRYFADEEYRASEQGRARVAKAPAVYAFLAKQYSAAKPKIPDLYEEYSGQALLLDQPWLDQRAGFAGLRIYSSSDFQAEHVFDVLQLTHDAALRRIFAHGYTKTVDYPELLGRTRQKIQLSIFATPDGKEDAWQGMAWDEARRLRKKFPDVGTTLVAVSDDVIKWGLDTPWVDYIIPFHASGIESEYFKALGWKNYEGVQDEEWLDRNAHKYIDKNGKEKIEKVPKIRMHELRAAGGIADREITRRYLALAEARGVRPVFPDFMEHPHFGKLKKDYARTDTPFRPVVADYDWKVARRILDGYFSGDAPKSKIIKSMVKRYADLREALPADVNIGVEAAKAIGENRGVVSSLRRLYQPGEQPLAKPTTPMLSPAFKNRLTGEVVDTPVFHDVEALAKALGEDPARLDMDPWQDGYSDKRGRFYDRQQAASLVGSTDRTLDSQVYADGVADKRLRQPGPENARGWVDIAREGMKKAVSIFLGDHANLSTYLHESAHTYLEMLGDMSDRADAPESVKRDHAAALSWLGVKDRTGITDAHHEKWARAFEAYLMDGKAPSIKLAGAFLQFKRWLTDIYKNVSALNVQLDDNLRGVFDRLLATDREIADMQTAMGMDKPMWNDPSAAGMRPEEFKAYLAERESLVTGAALRLQQQLAEERKRASTAAWHSEVEAAKPDAYREYDQRNDVQAANYVLKGRVSKPDGTILTDRELGKMDRLAARRILGPEFGALEEKLRGRLVIEGGEHPEDMAERFGFDDAGALLRAIIAVPERDATVEARAEEMVRERHPSLAEDRVRFEMAAADAMHNAGSVGVLFREVSALTRRVGAKEGRLTPREAYERAAWELVGRMGVGRLDAGQALARERSAAETAFRAAAKGNYTEALLAKQQQLLAHYQYKALTDAREVRDSFEKLLGQMDTTTRQQQLGKAGKVFFDPVATLLEALGVRDVDPAASGTRVPLADSIAELEADGITPGFNPDTLTKLMNAPPVGGWKGLTVDEMRDVGKAFKQFFTAARKRNVIDFAGQKISLNKLVESIGVDASVRPDLGKKLLPGVKVSWWQRQIYPVQFGPQTVQGIKAGLLEPEEMFRRLGTTAERFFFTDGYLKVRDAEYLLSKTTARFFLDNWETVPRDVRKHRLDLLPDSELKDLQIPADINYAPTMNRLTMWMIALNMGNRSNMDRLLGGYGWEEQKVRDFLNRNMSKAEWDFLASIGKLLDTELFPKVSEVYEGINGVPPEKIQPTSFETPYGTYEGWYFPAKYDPVASRVGREQSIEEIEKRYAQNSARISVSKTFTKERAKTYSDIVNLDWNVVPSHVAQVIHYITHDEFVRSAARVLNAAPFEKPPAVEGDKPLTVDSVGTVVERRLGVKYLPVVTDWLATVASARTDAVSPALAAMMRPIVGAKSRAVMASLAYSISVAAGDLTNYLTTFTTPGETKLRTLFLTPSVVELTTSPFETRARALAESIELQQRAEHVAMKIREGMGDIGRTDASKTLRHVRESAWYGMEVTDALISTAIYWTHKRQRLAEGLSEARAIEEAGKAVRSNLPSHNLAEQPMVLRDKRTLGALLMFYGYFAKLYTKHAKIWDDPYLKWHQANTVGKKATQYVPSVAKAMGYSLATMMVTNVLGEFASGRGRDPDEEVPEWILRKVAAAPFDTLPFMAPIGEELSNRLVPKLFGKEGRHRAFSLRAAPAAALVDRMGKALVHALDDNRDPDQRFWDMWEALNIVAKTPFGSSQVSKTGRYTTSGKLRQAVEEGRVGDAASGAVYGERANQEENILNMFDENR